jgi:hypothetical protein
MASSLLVDRLDSFVRFVNPLRTQADIRKRLVAGYVSVNGFVEPLLPSMPVVPNQRLVQYQTDGKG